MCMEFRLLDDETETEGMLLHESMLESMFAM